MLNSYIYPISARSSKTIVNPYLDHFMGALEPRFVFVNKDAPSGKGIMDIMKYLPKIDFVFFHWPENIAERKFGWMQALILFFLIPVFRIRNIRIIYVVHNKISHSQKKIRVKKLISKVLMNASWLLITHADEGVDFIKTLISSKKKIFYFPHPIDRPDNVNSAEKDIDVLIWGNIAPYKGVHNFLKSLNNQSSGWKGRVVIAGKVSTPEYKQQLLANKTENVTIIDDFVDDNTLNKLISRSRIVLFPYHQKSVLSSGAFAKTLAYPVHIVGPGCGAFLDFKELEHIHIFDDQEHIFDIISSIDFNKNHSVHPGISLELIHNYSWESFGKAFLNYLEN